MIYKFIIINARVSRKWLLFYLQVLYEELKLDQKLAPHTKVGKTDVSNQKSTCEASLHLLAAVHPLPALVLEYRQVQITDVAVCQGRN